MDKERKFNLAQLAYNNAYAKYSNFQVGAVVILRNGEYFIGSNVENASYGLTNCAERSALFATYSNGYRKEDIEELVIIAKSHDFVYPCGACRQVIIELMEPKATITLLKLDGSEKQIKVKDIMPFSFTESDLYAK